MKSSMQAHASAQSKKEPLPQELTVAAAWWAARTGDLSPEQASLFRDNLSSKLYEKYRGHWCVDNPMRGNAFRAILFDETTCDRVLSNAAQSSFISQFERRLPAEAVVMWVDPGSVSVKFLTSQKIKILYDSSDPAFSKDAVAGLTNGLTASPTNNAGAIAGSNTSTGSNNTISNPADTTSQLACAHEYSSLQVSTAVSVPQRV